MDKLIAMFNAPIYWGILAVVNVCFAAILLSLGGVVMPAISAAVAALCTWHMVEELNNGRVK